MKLVLTSDDGQVLSVVCEDITSFDLTDVADEDQLLERIEEALDRVSKPSDKLNPDQEPT